MIRKRQRRPGASVPPSGGNAVDSVAVEERWINREQLNEIIPASDMTLWRWQRDPSVAFPAPVKLGAGGRNYWWLPSIRAWMRWREQRGAAPPSYGGPSPGQRA
jgi:predicted DNA-binding transcriptional regulator AlpA